MVKIIPAILSSDPDEAKSLLSKAATSNVDRVQIDVIDGEFAKNKTVDPSIFQDLDDIPLIDFHLMVKEPINWVEKCVQSGADRIIGQVELMTDQEAFVNKVHEAGLSAGLAIDLDTPLSMIKEGLLGIVDVVLVMSVQAGYGGQKFNEEALPKIEELFDLRESMKASFAICDDGGITLETALLTASEGVDEICIGRRIFEGDLMDNIDRMQKTLTRVK